MTAQMIPVVALALVFGTSAVVGVDRLARGVREAVVPLLGVSMVALMAVAWLRQLP